MRQLVGTRAGKLPHSRVFVTSLGHVVYEQPLEVSQVYPGADPENPGGPQGGATQIKLSTYRRKTDVLPIF